MAVLGRNVVERESIVRRPILSFCEGYVRTMYVLAPGIILGWVLLMLTGWSVDGRKGCRASFDLPRVAFRRETTAVLCK